MLSLHYYSADLTRAVDDLYPMDTVPDSIDDASLRPHALATHLLDRATVQLPSVRYLGFRIEPPKSNITSALSISPEVITTADCGEESAATWRLQQCREFLPFEERVRMVSAEQADVVQPAAVAAGTAFGIGVGDTSARAVTLLEGHDGEGAIAATGASGGLGSGADSGAAAKKFPVVLADYLSDASTVGMAVVDQPGTGLTTALLSFLEWYCRGEAAGGRRVRVILNGRRSWDIRCHTGGGAETFTGK